LHWIGTDLCDPTTYDGLTDISSFVKDFELALDVFLKATLARWWDADKEGMEDWSQCRSLIQARFGTEVEYVAHRYT